LLELGASSDVHNAQGVTAIDKALDRVESFANEFFHALVTSNVDDLVKYPILLAIANHRSFDVSLDIQVRDFRRVSWLKKLF
jgi:hypothetical protein